MRSLVMRVAWNLLWLRPGVVGGSEEYATRQLLALAQHASADVEVTAFVLQPFVNAYPELAESVRCIPMRLDGRNKPRRVVAESTWLAARTRKGFDVVHHVGGRVPSIAPAPRVLTIHDLQPLEEPENFSAVKRHFLARSLPRSAARARIVITPSEHVRARVIERFGLDPAGVRAIAAPVTIPEVALAQEAAAPSVLDDALRALLDRDAPFFLYPAITYLHKNHLVVLEAFALVRRAHPQVRLVLTQGAGGAEQAVAARIAQPDLAGSVLRPGRVERAVLDLLLTRATALVFPSRFEGFGLPVIEALAAKCPVISSSATALSEVVGDAGVLVDPDDIDAWAAAMSAALSDPAYRTARAERGLAVARRYAPDATAAALTSVYREIAAGW